MNGTCSSTRVTEVSEQVNKLWKNKLAGIHIDVMRVHLRGENLEVLKA